MIIKRKYATFWTLMKDKLTADVMVEAIKKADSNRSDQEIRDLLSMDAPIIFYQADLGSMIPGYAYDEMKLRFEELDKTNPLDNGLTYQDVSKVITFPSRKGNAMVQWLIREETADCFREIVQIIAFEKDGENIKPVEPWDVGNILF